MISDEYRKLNEHLHETHDDYGTYGWILAGHVFRACNMLQTTDVLDYGCGKGTLNLNLPFGIQCYDPAVFKYSAPPQPADVVVCCDVMEHVEPEYLDAVLDHLVSLTKHVCLFMIHTRPAKKFLPDGRNAHISLHDEKWWLDKLGQYFDHSEHTVYEGLLKVATTPKGKQH